MGKRRKILLMILLLGMTACAGKEETKTSDPASPTPTQMEAETGEGENGEQEETEVDEYNRKLIAEALSIPEDSRSIRFILGSLKTVGAGKLQTAEAAEENGDKYLNVLAEDGTNYAVLLSRSGSPEGVKNLDTGEWEIRSER